ncbi:MAG TPA: hypothetical protein VEY09_07000 [Pyrinomonadaceae bacterium]|nr:hypothetical protein [Pyrinomonadaceae bacterium]
MSEPRSQRIVILKRAITDSVDRAAAGLRRDFAGGLLRSGARIDVPGAPPSYFNLLREREGAPFRIEFDRGPAPCAACQRAMGENLRRCDDADRLHLFLRDAVQIWHACDCFPGNRPAGAQGQARHPEQQPAGWGRVRVGGNRPSPDSASPPGEVRMLPPQGAPREAARRVPPPEGEGGRQRAAVELAYELPESRRATLLLTAEFADALTGHCRESVRHGREVGGMVVGYANEAGPREARGGGLYLIATDAVPFRATESSHAHLHLDEDAWVHIGELIDSDFVPQGKVRLGWYHTHPTQGVLFSERDLDVHTNFRQPHQFAIVVDPRTMDAGLYFWDDQPRKRLGEAVYFSVAARGGGAAAAASRMRAAGAPRAAGERPAAARLLALVALLAGLTGYVTFRSFAVPLTPDEACAVALAVLISLRLWNAGAFHYRPHLEGRAARSLDRLVRRGYAGLLHLLSEAPRSLLLGLIVLLALTICALLLYPRLSAPTAPAPGAPAAAQSDAAGPPASHDAGATAAMRKFVRLELKEKKSGAVVILELSNPSLRQRPLAYGLSAGADGREAVSLRSSSAEERQFVGTTFDRQEIAALQRALNVETTGANVGTWGPQTRTAFLLGARAAAAAGRPLQAEVPDRGVLSVEFK